MDVVQESVKNNQHSGGRPSVITEAVVVKLIAAFQSGMTDRLACQYAGIDKSTYYRKCKEDVEFCDQIQGAKDFLKLQAGQRVSQILTKGSDRDAGPMARWILEKTIPEIYGNQALVQNNIQQNNYYNLTHEEIGEIASALHFENVDPTELLEALESEDPKIFDELIQKAGEEK